MADRYSPEYLKDILVRLKDPKEGIKLKKKQIEKKKKVQCVQGAALLEWLLRDIGERTIVSKAEVVSTIQALIDRRLLATAEGNQAQTFGEGEDYIFQEEAQESLELEILLKDSDYTTIDMVAVAMSAESGGVPLSTKKHRLKKYKNCFSGNEAVAWFASNLMLSRAEDSLALGQFLLNKGFIVNVISKTEPFTDKSSSVFRLSDSIDGSAGTPRGSVSSIPPGGTGWQHVAGERSSSPARPLPPVTTPGQPSPADVEDLSGTSPRRGLARPPSVRGSRGGGVAAGARPAPPRGAAPRGGAPPTRGAAPPPRGFVQGRGQPGRGRRQAPLLAQTERRASASREDGPPSPDSQPPRVRPPPRAASTTGVIRSNPAPPPPQRQMTVDMVPPDDAGPILEEPPDVDEIGGLTKPPVVQRPPAPVRPAASAANRSSENIQPPPVGTRVPSRPSLTEKPALPAGAPPASMQRTGSAQWARPAPRRGSINGSPTTSPSPRMPSNTAPARDISVTIGKPVDEVGSVKQQLISSEQAFVNTSFACLKAYCDDVPASVLSKTEKEQIFGNLNELVEVHYNILSTVNDATRPSDILSQIVPHLHLYLSYIANSQRAHSVLSIVRDRPAFADVLQDASSKGLVTIEGLLESPAGRLDEFPPMITDFIQRLSNNQGEAQALQFPLEKFAATQAEKNRRKCLPEHLMRVWDIEHSFSYDENIKMDMSTAFLVNEGTMSVVKDTRAEANSGDEIHLFVFKDMYIAALPTNGYALKSLIRVPKGKLVVRDVPAAECKNALELLEVDHDRKILISFPAAKDKRRWMSDLPVRYEQVMRMTIPLPL